MDTQDFGDTGYAGGTPNGTSMQRWVSGLQDYIDGKPTDYDPRQGVPAGYKIDNGKVVQQGQWDQWGKGATEFFASALPTMLAGTNIPGLGPGTSAAEGGSMGTLDSILNIVGKGSQIYSSLSDVLGGAAKSSQQQNNTQDTLNLALYNAKNNAALAAKKFALTAPSTRMKTSMQAILPKYAQPAQVHWGGPGSGLRGEVPTWTGGAKSIIDASKDPQYRQLGDQVMNDELVSQMQGGASGGNQDVSTATPPPIGQTSAGDKILGGTSLTASILAALSKRNPASGAPPVPTFPTYGPADPDPYGLNS